jgi:hypothetical protein
LNVKQFYKMNTILSLFDHTGEWGAPFLDHGYDVVPMDIQDGLDVMARGTCEGWLNFLDMVDGVLAAVPCTDFAVSGARWFARKDADGSTAKSVELVRQTLRIINLHYPTDLDYDLPFFWAIENPVGRIARLVPEIGRPRLWFDPCDYAGHVGLTDAEENELDRLRRKDGKGFTLEEAGFVMRTNCYTKKTGLWGCFNPDLKKDRREPVRCNTWGSPMMSYGGDNEATKNARSATPAGFAKAFADAQAGWMPDRWEPDTLGALV